MLLVQVKNYLFILIFLLSNFGFSQTLNIQKKAIEKQIGDASINFQSGNYENALNLSQLALIESLKLDDEFLIAHSYNSIGVIYNEFSNAKRAKEFYNKALFHAEKTNDDKLKNWVYGNLGSFYYFDENNQLTDIVQSQDAEIIDAAYVCLNFLHKNNLVGDHDNALFTAEQGKLIRKQIICKCSKPNYCDQNAPEYGKPWKPANNSGCVGCHKDCVPQSCDCEPTTTPTTPQKTGCFTSVRSGVARSISRRGSRTRRPRRSGGWNRATTAARVQKRALLLVR